MYLKIVQDLFEVACPWKIFSSFVNFFHIVHFFGPGSESSRSELLNSLREPREVQIFDPWLIFCQRGSVGSNKKSPRNFEEKNCWKIKVFKKTLPFLLIFFYLFHDLETFWKAKFFFYSFFFCYFMRFEKFFQKFFFPQKISKVEERWKNHGSHFPNSPKVR